MNNKGLLERIGVRVGDAVRVSELSESAGNPLRKFADHVANATIALNCEVKLDSTLVL